MEPLARVYCPELVALCVSGFVVLVVCGLSNVVGGGAAVSTTDRALLRLLRERERQRRSVAVSADGPGELGSSQSAARDLCIVLWCPQAAGLTAAFLRPIFLRQWD